MRFNSGEKITLYHALSTPDLASIFPICVLASCTLSGAGLARRWVLPSLMLCVLGQAGWEPIGVTVQNHRLGLKLRSRNVWFSGCVVCREANYPNYKEGVTQHNEERGTYFWLAFSIKSMGSSAESGPLNLCWEICNQKWHSLYSSVFLIVLLSDLI